MIFNSASSSLLSVFGFSRQHVQLFTGTKQKAGAESLPLWAFTLWILLGGKTDVAFKLLIFCTAKEI